jgi:hypothetical protein
LSAIFGLCFGLSCGCRVPTYYRYLLAASGFTVYLLSKSGMSFEDKGVRVGFGLKLDQQSFLCAAMKVKALRAMTVYFLLTSPYCDVGHEWIVSKLLVRENSGDLSRNLQTLDMPIDRSSFTLIIIVDVALTRAVVLMARRRGLSNSNARQCRVSYGRLWYYIS